MAGKTPNSQGIVMDSKLSSGLHKLTLARLLHRTVVCSVALLKFRHIAQVYCLAASTSCGWSFTEFALREMWSIDSSYHMNSQQNHIPLKKGRLQTLCKVIHCAGCVLTNTKPHQLSWDDWEMGPAIQLSHKMKSGGWSYPYGGQKLLKCNVCLSCVIGQ